MDFIEAEFRYPRQSSEVIFRYPRKIAEAEFWLRLHPEEVVERTEGEGVTDFQ